MDIIRQQPWFILLSYLLFALVCFFTVLIKKKGSESQKALWNMVFPLLLIAVMWLFYGRVD